MKCKICGNIESKFLYCVNDIDMCKCKRCNFVFFNNDESIEKYNYQCDYFDNNKYKDTSCQYRENNRRKKLISKYCGTKVSLVDVGCAAGDFVAFVSETFDAVGYDFAESAIELAKRRYPHLADKYYVCAAENMISEENASYDAVCLWDVIEHIEEPKQVMKTLKTLVKNDGYIFISTPNIGALFAKITKKRWPFMTPPEHMSFFDKKSMCRLIAECDLELVERKSKGKWANVGFIFYKMNRVMPNIVFRSLFKLFKKGILSKINIYVPTSDIQYLVLRKR